MQVLYQLSYGPVDAKDYRMRWWGELGLTRAPAGPWALPVAC